MAISSAFERTQVYRIVSIRIWPNYISLESLLLSHSSTSQYAALPPFINCLYHCYIYRSLQAWLLQFCVLWTPCLNYPSPRTIVKAPKSCHITPILSSLHWLRITERIENKLLSLIYKVLTTTQPPYLHNLISVQGPRSTLFSSVVTLARLPTLSSLKITDRSFRYALPCLWNQLPLSLRRPHSGTSFPFPNHLFLQPSLFLLNLLPP